MADQTLKKLNDWLRRKNPAEAQRATLASPGGRCAVKKAAETLGISEAAAFKLAQKKGSKRKRGRPPIIDQFSKVPCRVKRWLLRRAFASAM